jgi:hypothetical protein
MDGPAGDPIPNDRGLALIGNAKRRNLFRAPSSLLQRRAHGGERGCPNRFGIVLDLTGTRIDLRKFLLRSRNRDEIGIE